MSSIFNDREKALGEPWAKKADAWLAIRARAQRRLAEWAAESAGHPETDRPLVVRRLLKAGFLPEGETAFLAAVTEMTGEDESALRDRLDRMSEEIDAKTDAPRI